MSGLSQSSPSFAPRPTMPPQAIGAESEILRQILDPDVNLSLWQRPDRADISQELSALAPSDLPDVRCSTSLETFDDDVSMLLEEQGFDPSAFPNWRADLLSLADYYFSVSGRREVTLRLQTTNKNGCRRFHVDHTNLRLLCTYRGPGTEWLADEQVDRSALGAGVPNSDIIRFGEPAQFAPFWVGIMKGKAYPGNSAHGLVHRSPQVELCGRMRVLFCLDW